MSTLRDTMTIEFAARLEGIARFYQLLDRLREIGAGVAPFSQFNRATAIPKHGVYFFFEFGEERCTSDGGLRVVRVGTHGLNAGSSSTLRGRLRAHRGQIGGRHPGGGNHRGSVFRKHVGYALIAREPLLAPSTSQWGRGSSAPRPVRDGEYSLERVVSAYLGQTSVLWVEVDDTPGSQSLRGYVERNAIALLSNLRAAEAPIDPPSVQWLGRFSPRFEIRKSGLWNVEHVDDRYDPSFLHVFERLVAVMAEI